VLGDAQGNGNKFGAGQTYNNETEVAAGVRYKFWTPLPCFLEACDPRFRADDRTGGPAIARTSRHRVHCAIDGRDVALRTSQEPRVPCVQPVRPSAHHGDISPIDAAGSIRSI